MNTLREAIEQAVAILGPEAPLCSGCVDEWTEALRILNDALAEQSAEPGAMDHLKHPSRRGDVLVPHTGQMVSMVGVGK